LRFGAAEFCLRGFALKISAASVFHSSQVEHCPCHFGEAAPQFWQTKTSFDFAMGSLAPICEFRIADIVARSPILPGFVARIMSIA